VRRSTGAPALLAALLLAARTGQAAPEGELLREEAYNYRVVGTLPRGWRRPSDALAFVFSIDDIPHAYVHLVRARVQGEVDVAGQIRRRAANYHFPGAGEDPVERTEDVRWGGRPALRYEHEAKIGGVTARRVVTAMVERSHWYELIETVYGDATAARPEVRDGIAVFRDGFRLLVPPLPPAAAEDPAEAVIADRDLGYRLVKPAGFLRVDVEPAIDPGCRLAFERKGPGRQHARVRLFEYGVWRSYDAKTWLDNFFAGFAGSHLSARREPAAPPEIRGAEKIDAERFTGTRDDAAIVTEIALIRARDGRVFALRIRTQDGAAEAFRDALAAVVSSLELATK